MQSLKNNSTTKENNKKYANTFRFCFAVWRDTARLQGKGHYEKAQKILVGKAKGLFEYIPRAIQASS